MLPNIPLQEPTRDPKPAVAGASGHLLFLLARHCVYRTGSGGLISLLSLHGEKRLPSACCYIMPLGRYMRMEGRKWWPSLAVSSTTDHWLSPTFNCGVILECLSIYSFLTFFWLWAIFSVRLSYHLSFLFWGIFPGIGSCQGIDTHFSSRFSIC